MISSESSKKFSLTIAALSVTTSRSSGPGGQHVQKTETKVRAAYYLAYDVHLSESQKNSLRTWLKNNKPKHYLPEEDIIVAEDQSTRSQKDNFNAAKKKIFDLIIQGIRKPKKRIATKPTHSSKLKRLSTKRAQSVTKQNRRKATEES